MLALCSIVLLFSNDQLPDTTMKRRMHYFVYNTLYARLASHFHKVMKVVARLKTRWQFFAIMIYWYFNFRKNFRNQLKSRKMKNSSTSSVVLFLDKEFGLRCTICLFVAWPTMYYLNACVCVIACWGVCAFACLDTASRFNGPLFPCSQLCFKVCVQDFINARWQQTYRR